MFSTNFFYSFGTQGAHLFYGPKPPVLYIGLHSLSPPNIIKSFSLISQRDARSLSTAGSPSSMALLSLLVSKPSLKTSFLPLTSHLIPIIPSSPLSSHCTTPTFPLPSQSPPVPKKRPFNISAHTRTWQDPYHWMRNAKDPDFVDYLNQENSYAQAFMADTQNLQRTLLEEMKNRLPTQISTPPERWGHWFFPFAPILLTVMTNFITLHYKYVNLVSYGIEINLSRWYGSYAVNFFTFVFLFHLEGTFPGISEFL